MNDPVVIMGLGEMGGVFARGFLRLGHPVYPLTRNQSAAELAAQIPEPALVLVAVAEGDLQSAMSDIPAPWRSRTCLLQNELLPADWQTLDEPTVISVWFEKKPGMDYKVIIPSPVHGPNAQLVADALGAINIPTKVVGEADELLFELVLKNLYILTSNIAGLQVGGTVGTLWADHQALAREVVADVLKLQEAMTGEQFDTEGMIAAMCEAFDGDPDHKCMGRSAPARLARALEQAGKLGISLPTFERIAREQASA
ncbi:MAG: hypothetical protein ABW085_05675 [Sedimenticola sp.]